MRRGAGPRVSTSVSSADHGGEEDSVVHSEEEPEDQPTLAAVPPDTPTALIPLDRDQVPGALKQQRAGQAAGPRPDLDHRARGKIATGARDAARQVHVEQEMLTQALARAQPVAGDDIAKRG